jgi:hypothetical protein
MESTGFRGDFKNSKARKCFISVIRKKGSEFNLSVNTSSKNKASVHSIEHEASQEKLLLVFREQKDIEEESINLFPTFDQIVIPKEIKHLAADLREDISSQAVSIIHVRQHSIEVLGAFNCQQKV